MLYAIAAGSLVAVILGVIGLVDLFRVRDTLETWKVVAWAIFIVLIPIFGLISWLLWRLARSQALIDAMDSAAGVGQSPEEHRVRPVPPASP